MSVALLHETDKLLLFLKAISLTRADLLPKDLKKVQTVSRITLIPAFPSIKHGRELPCAQELTGEAGATSPILLVRKLPLLEAAQVGRGGWSRSLELLRVSGWEKMVTSLPPSSVLLKYISLPKGGELIGKT